MYVTLLVSIVELTNMFPLYTDPGWIFDIGPKASGHCGAGRVAAREEPGGLDSGGVYRGAGIYDGVF